MVKTYYYAVDKDGQGWYYDNPPIFDGESWNVDPTYDCLECMGAVNDLHPANLFSFPIPEDMTYEDEPPYGLPDNVSLVYVPTIRMCSTCIRNRVKDGIKPFVRDDVYEIIKQYKLYV